MFGLEILEYLDARDDDERQRFQIANSLVAAGVDLYRAMPDRFARPPDESTSEPEAIEDPEAALDLRGVEWEMPTEEEFNETQKLLMSMAANRTTTVREGPGSALGPADDDREWT